MSEYGPLFSSDKPERTPRERMIAAMGAIAFNFELGPNARTPENGPEVLETGVIVTDDEATYIAGTLGPAIAETAAEPTER